MDTSYLQFLLYILGAILLGALIVLVVKLVYSVNHINNILDSVEQKMKTVDKAFNAVDRLVEDKKVIDLLPDNKINNKEKNKDKDEGNFLGILNDVPGDDSNDEIKGLKNLISYLKKMIKEKDKILNDLLEQVQEIFKELKWNIKTIIFF